MSLFYSNNILGENKPLIDREQTYFLDRKLLTVHSVDRDVDKYPNVNNFEVTLPQIIKNVQSIRLTDISIFEQSYNYTNNYQNTKIAFKVIPLNNGRPDYAILATNSTNNYIATIENGLYNSEELANELAGQMNQAVTNYLISQGSTNVYDSFYVKYNSVTGKMWIANNLDTFTLSFSLYIQYDISCGYNVVFNNDLNWGLPYNLGFKKEDYNSIPKVGSSGLKFYYDNLTWVVPDVSGNNTVNYVESPLKFCSNDYNVIYMEIDKYNTMDELEPNPTGTNNLYNNKFNGKVNSVFAKISLWSSHNSNNVSTLYNPMDKALNNTSFYNPVIEKIQKLTFKFRYHDGTLVDFGNCNINFTLQFNCLFNEIKRKYDLRIPQK